MAQVRITDSSGVERSDSPIPLITLEKEQALRTATLARIGVTRDDLDSVSGLTPGRDRVFVEDPAGNDTFGGILRTPGRGGSVPEIVGDSFAEYMRRAQNVPRGQEKVGADDDTLIQEAIDATDQLSAGTLSTVTGGQTWVFGAESQLSKARSVEEAAGGELVFNTDLTVDYGSKQHGSDKTGTTLSPANGSFAEGTFVLQEDGRTGDITHLEVYGVGQGSGQLLATIVPSDDTASYTNKATYTNNDWSAGDDKIWNSEPYVNKDIKRVSPLQEWGKTLIGDLQTTRTVVDTVVKGTTVNLGDEFTVANPAEGLSPTTLRAVEVTKLIGPEAGTRYEVTFSNHSHALDSEDKRLEKDRQRYGSAYEGDNVTQQYGPGRGPVGPNHDYIMFFDYPDDVVAELSAEVVIKGRNYRAYSAGAATNAVTSGSSTSPAPLEAQNSDSGADVSLTADTENVIDSVTPSNDTQWLEAGVIIENQKSSTVPFNVTVEGTGSFSEYPAAGNGGWFFNIESGGRMPLFITLPGNWNGETASIQVEPIGEGATIDYISYFKAQGTHTHSVDHAHDPDPGIIDFDGSDQSPAHYPENVDVVVNGSSQGTSFGDGTGEFNSRQDISGQLSAGENTVKLTSDGLGHLDAYVVTDLVRQRL